MPRLAVVTGATRGIGAAIAIKLKADGYTVAANYIGNGGVAEAFQKKTGIDCFKFDVSDFQAVQDGMAGIAAKLGPVDIVVNNAGITRDSFLHKMTLDQWHSVIHVNLTSCFNVCRAVVPDMRQRGFGRIVNISSINGQKGQMGQTNYCAAKAGMIGFSRALALENASKGITVNCICPGYTDTEMTREMDPAILENIRKEIPVGRLGTVSEIADMAAFLVRDEAGFMTGATFSVNGGHYMA
ncbi:MAG: acetoacetyl-CoA reductase [Pseudomonadota bacterium]|nr:acetoacetyl-CoA reductase [Pseudomonadota bacterium]